MSELDLDNERADQAASKLADGLRNCRSVVKSYRLIFAEHPEPEQRPEPEDPASDAQD
jgi:hypothetical protein